MIITKKNYIEDDEIEYSGPSRTQKKKEMLELQSLAEALVKQSPDMIKKSGLPQYFVEEVIDAINVKTHEAKRRQIQYLGKLIRDIETDPIREFLENIETGNRSQNKKFHQLEKWRDSLIEGDFSTIDIILEKYPHAERQRISQLARNGRKEKDQNKPPKASRALFKLLREISESNS